MSQTFNNKILSPIYRELDFEEQNFVTKSTTYIPSKHENNTNNIEQIQYVPLFSNEFSSSKYKKKDFLTIKFYH